jgi:hypothetical protein
MSKTGECFGLADESRRPVRRLYRFRSEKPNRDRATCRGTFKEVKAGCGTRPQERDLAQSVRSQAGVVEWCFVDIDTLQSTDEMVIHFVWGRAGVVEECFA